MFLGKALMDKSITNQTRERDINHPTFVHVPNFSIAEEEFTTSKSVRLNSDVRPF